MELPPEVIALCVSAGTLVANSMASDLYHLARAGLQRLGRVGPAHMRQIERLDRDRAEVIAAPENQQQAVILDVSNDWKTRLRDLLEEYPELVPELEALVKQLEAAGGSSDSKNLTVINQRAGKGGQNIYSGRDTNVGRKR
ncbi:hypothetical protein [Micromonospora eburnea]|uniref:hypothetical protein n=1 Tax=Micromonospora eburnea TaxID=227316 RepID=UPI00114CF1A2|nr:hypothetical protein [Micromonospora eburnea]